MSLMAWGDGNELAPTMDSTVCCRLPLVWLERRWTNRRCGVMIFRPRSVLYRRSWNIYTMDGAVDERAPDITDHVWGTSRRENIVCFFCAPLVNCFRCFARYGWIMQRQRPKISVRLRCRPPLPRIAMQETEPTKLWFLRSGELVVLGCTRHGIRWTPEQQILMDWKLRRCLED